MKTQIFRGWYVVLAAHLLLAVIFGAAYSFGAFFASIQANFDAGRFSVASVFSLTAFIYYSVGVFSGSLADRISTRVVVGIGVVLLALGFLVGSVATGSLGGLLFDLYQSYTAPILLGGVCALLSVAFIFFAARRTAHVSVREPLARSAE